VLLEADSPLPEGFLPELEPELIAPAVEAGAEPPGALHEVREPLIAPREEPFQEAHPGVVPLEADVAVFHAPLEVALFCQGLLETDLADPLEGRVGLGNQGRKAEVTCLPRPSFMTRCARSAIPSRSSSCSPGRPIMK